MNPKRLSQDELVQKVLDLERRLAESHKETTPQQKKEFPKLGRILPAFNRQNVLDDARLNEEQRRKAKVPAHVSNLSVAVTTQTVTITYSRLEVTYTITDPANTKTVRVWIKGYNTVNELGAGSTGEALSSLPWQLIQEVDATGVVEFSLPSLTAAEEIVLGLQAVNGDGVEADIRYIPQKQVTLI